MKYDEGSEELSDCDDETIVSVDTSPETIVNSTSTGFGDLTTLSTVMTVRSLRVPESITTTMEPSTSLQSTRRMLDPERTSLVR